MYEKDSLKGLSMHHLIMSSFMSTHKILVNVGGMITSVSLCGYDVPGHSNAGKDTVKADHFLCLVLRQYLSFLCLIE